MKSKVRKLKRILCVLMIVVKLSQAQTANYEYDKLQRLTKITYTNGSTVTYQYDANGNRLSHAVGITPGVAIDVTIQNASLVSSVVQQGGTVTLNGTEVNIGTTAAVAHYVRFFLSANNILDVNDVQLDQWLLTGLTAGAGAAFNNRTIQIPGPTATGNYFLLVVADGSNALAEVNEGNNLTALPLTVSTATSIIDPQNPTMPIRVTPNPASQVLYVTGLQSNKRYTYTLSDHAGRILLKGTIAQTNQQQISISKLAAGVYMLTLYNLQQGKLLGTEKIIVVQ